MSRKIITLALLFGLVFSIPNSLAQSIFDIEFVFFKRIDQQDNSAQVKETELPDIETEFDFSNLPEDFTLLTNDELKLHGVWARLRSSQNIRPLLHIGWRQPLLNKSETPWLAYSASDAPEEAGLDEFNGLIRFSRNQGLLVEHKVTGFKPLNLPEEFMQSSDEENSDYQYDRVDTFDDSAQEPVVDMQMPDQLHGYFVLSENRKIKLDELHYFDHPNMGILLKVTAYKASLEEQEALQNP
ncbi:CsiV family protein [Kangiella sp.]|uniref:CsiV family protein n=1 Tax=Kangiella sp. TaxID=1920245 RepID=UPI0019C8BCBF|nr:CsiV family protein [Kangiella sp.]MBD3654315.1 hypothetical protein [Kangiella sp.]